MQIISENLEEVGRRPYQNWHEIIVNQASVNACEENFLWTPNSSGQELKVQMPGLYQLKIVIIAKTALADKLPLRILVNNQVVASFYEAEAAPISCPPRELQP